MKVIVFDTETTGLPKNQKSEPSINNLTDWPHIVQLSWIMYDTDKCSMISESDYIIKMTDGVIIPEESTKIHKITNEMCKTKGENLCKVIDKFMKNFDEADLIVAHNMLFDHNMLKAELLRILTNHEFEFKNLLYYDNLLNSKKLFCTMQETMEICCIKAKFPKSGKEYVKFPSLEEVHNYYFGYKPTNLHNALVDVMVCARCFHMLRFGKDICEDNIKFRRFTNNLS